MEQSVTWFVGRILDTIIEVVERISLDEQQQFAPVEIKQDKSLMQQLFHHSRVFSQRTGWFDCAFNTPYYLKEVRETTEEFRVLRNGFDQRMPAAATLKKIVRVENAYLILQYELKLQQKKRIHGEVVESRLYHGTKRCNIESICGNNFDWRKLGANGMRSSKFGQGVSFSPDIRYASDYPRRYLEDPRIMFVAKVMEVSRCVGDDRMEIPPLPHDTSADLRGNKVVVKYFDNEYYPEYIIYYDYYP